MLPPPAQRSALATAIWRRACAASTATAQLAIRDRTLSARLVRMIGTRAPSTRPALSALARKLSCLARMLPASRSGASRMSGSPATSDRMPLICAASLLIALSKASGPSSSPPVICPRSAILQRAAASIVAGIFEVTVSTAARIATFGRSSPSEIARSIAFWQMSTLSSSVGAMLIAASVTIRTL